MLAIEFTRDLTRWPIEAQYLTGNRNINTLAENTATLPEVVFINTKEEFEKDF